MNWRNLKTNKCPSCNKDWMGSYGQNLTLNGKIMIHKCGFKISEMRYGQIVSGMVEKDLEEEKFDDDTNE